MERLLSPKLSIIQNQIKMGNQDLEIYKGKKKELGGGAKIYKKIWFPNPGISSLIKLSIFSRNAEQEHRPDKDVGKSHPGGDAAKLQRSILLPRRCLKFMSNSISVNFFLRLN